MWHEHFYKYTTSRSSLWVPNDIFFTLERLCKMHTTQMPVQVCFQIGSAGRISAEINRNFVTKYPFNCDSTCIFIYNSFSIKKTCTLNYFVVLMIQRDNENRDERTVLDLWKSLVQVWMLTQADCDWGVYETVTSVFSDYWIAQYDTWIELH